MNKNLSLYIGIAIPILMIIGVAASIYAPRWFSESPRYGFLYLESEEFAPYDGKLFYSVRDGHLIEEKGEVVKIPGDPYPVRYRAGKLFRYDIRTQKSTEISLEEAKNLSLIQGQRSPDGFEVICSHNNRGNFFPFFDGGYSDCSRRYLVNDIGYSEEVYISASARNYYNFELIGWIDTIDI